MRHLTPTERRELEAIKRLTNLMTPDHYQELALKTWYSPDDSRYLDPRHPLIKLAGEAGELLDLYGKHEYKPGFDWWRCKACGFMPEDKKRSEVDYYAFTCINGKEHTPLVLDELGDYSYYLRIASFQQGYSFEKLCSGYHVGLWKSRETDMLLSWMNIESANILNSYLQFNTLPLFDKLQNCTWYLLSILRNLDIDLEQIINLNYIKLNSEPTARGWKSSPPPALAMKGGLP